MLKFESIENGEHIVILLGDIRIGRFSLDGDEYFYKNETEIGMRSEVLNEINAKLLSLNESLLIFGYSRINDKSYEVNLNGIMYGILEFENNGGWLFALKGYRFEAEGLRELASRLEKLNGDVPNGGTDLEVYIDGVDAGCIILGDDGYVFSPDDTLTYTTSQLEAIVNELKEING